MASTSKTPRTQSKSHAAHQNALDLLKADHKKVTELFEQFEKASGDDKKKQLATEICQALTIHAQVEEEFFYPEVKAALKDHELVPEATIEHGSIKNLIAQIEADQEGGEMFDAKVKVLCEYVKHHVKEEEKEMFPKIKKEAHLDLDEMGDRLMQQMESLQAARH